MAKAIVIGAGVGGLAAAIRLAAKGYKVIVFEANSYAGGKLSEIKCGKSRFDAGPSLFTMPQYVDELFIIAGKNPRKYFSYNKLDVVCKYFFEDGTLINAFAEADDFAHEIEKKTSDNATEVMRFFQKSAKIYSITNHIFLQRSLHKLRSYLNIATIRSILNLGQIDAMQTMAASNSSRFKDDKTRRIFNRYATYNGSNPYAAPATLNVIPHLEQHYGAYFPDGGMFSVTKALLALTSDLGIEVRYNSPVEEIIVERKRAVGIRIAVDVQSADVVVSNMDIWFTYKKMLPKLSPPKRIGQERSSSALIFYWEVNRVFPELDLHNIFFSDDYEAEFNSIWKEKSITADPTIYVNISAKQNRDDAPEGCENWFVMINVPSNSGQDWNELINFARTQIINKLSRILNIDIQSLINCEKVLDPTGIEYKTSSYQGALYGTSSNSRFAAFLRHPNFSSKVQNLYFVGGSVHPGGGIPLALLSAKIVDGLIKK